MDGAITRAELADTYARPYVQWLPVAHRIEHVHTSLTIAILIGVATAVTELVADGGAPTLLVILAWAMAAATVLRAAWVTVAASLVIRDRTRDWQPDDDDELARVRAWRPHAQDADALVAHDEYAVSVSDDGCLVTWQFAPIAAFERTSPRERVVRGTPMYVAHEVERVAFEPTDAALAAEQLAEAQEDAARREAAAAERAHAELGDAERARELLAEAQSTGVALRGVTGQSRD